MNANQIIETMGGRAEVMRITRLSKGRLSQWVKQNEIPRAWLMFFHERHPDLIPHPDEARPELKEAEHA